jgi:gamma-glutamylputrescine oxidase
MSLLKKELGVAENSWYEASVLRELPEPPLDRRETADVCVIGAGLAGVSASLELALRGYTVVALEAQRIGWGASGRNGGQAIVGFGTDGEAAIESQLTEGDARHAWALSVEGLALMRERMQRWHIDCDYVPGFLNVSTKPGKTRALHEWAARVEQRYGYAVQLLGPGEITDWIASRRFQAGLFDANSGHLHPLKYCLGLARAARGAGVRFHEHSPVYVVERGRQPLVKTAHGEVSCRFVVLAGNVYLGEYGDEIAPALMSRIMPVGTYIIATEPMERARADALMWQRPAVSDNNFVLDYFRLSADHRLLFGAGDSYSGKTPRDLVPRIRKRMLGVFPQLEDLEITHSWGGFADITMNRAPDFGRIGSNIYYLQGFSGHGLVFTGMAGKLAAESIAGQAGRFDVFSRIKHLSFPGGRLMRTPALVLGMMYYQLRDLLG